MTEINNNTSIKIFDGITNLAGVATRCLLATRDNCDQIDKLKTMTIELGLEQMTNDISSHLENVDELQKRISSQTEFVQNHKQSIDSISTDMNYILESVSDIENYLEQLKIDLVQDGSPQ